MGQFSSYGVKNLVCFEGVLPSPVKKKLRCLDQFWSFYPGVPQKNMPILDESGKKVFSEFQNAVSRRSEGVVGPDFGRKTTLKYILVFFELLNATSGIHGCAASSIEDQLTPAIDTGIAL